MGLFDSISKKTPNFSVIQNACLSSTPTKNTSAGGWQQWHSTLIKCFGKSGANDVWILAWERYGRSNPNAYSTTLGRYMQSQGINIAQSGGENMALASANIFSAFGGMFNFIKILNMVVAGGIAVGFLMLLYTIIVNPDKAKKTMSVVTEGALLATPAGRGISAVSATGIGAKQITG
jgi:hypothetical protein